MNTTLQKAVLQLDDYLDLLNLAINLGDTRWQKKLSVSWPTLILQRLAIHPNKPTYFHMMNVIHLQ